MPMSSEVTVMPSWAPDRWNERWRRRPRAMRARRLPCSAAWSTRLRSTATRANSAATKNPLSRMSRTTARSPSAVLMGRDLR
jgi:hypothetical protein